MANKPLKRRTRKKTMRKKGTMRTKEGMATPIARERENSGHTCQTKQRPRAKTMETKQRRAVTAKVRPLPSSILSTLSPLFFIVHLLYFFFASIVLFLYICLLISYAGEAQEATDSETENPESVHELHAKWEAEQEQKRDSAIQNKISGDWRKVFTLSSFSSSSYLFPPSCLSCSCFSPSFHVIPSTFPLSHHPFTFVTPLINCYSERTGPSNLETVWRKRRRRTKRRRRSEGEESEARETTRRRERQTHPTSSPAKTIVIVATTVHRRSFTRLALSAIDLWLRYVFEGEKRRERKRKEKKEGKGKQNKQKQNIFIYLFTCFYLQTTKNKIETDNNSRSMLEDAASQGISHLLSYLSFLFFSFFLSSLFLPLSFSLLLDLNHLSRHPAFDTQRQQYNTRSRRILFFFFFFFSSLSHNNIIHNVKLGSSRRCQPPMTRWMGPTSRSSAGMDSPSAPSRTSTSTSSSLLRGRISKYVERARKGGGHIFLLSSPSRFVLFFFR